MTVGAATAAVSWAEVLRNCRRLLRRVVIDVLRGYEAAGFRLEAIGKGLEGWLCSVRSEARCSGGSRTTPFASSGTCHPRYRPWMRIVFGSSAGMQEIRLSGKVGHLAGVQPSGCALHAEACIPTGSTPLSLRTSLDDISRLASGPFTVLFRRRRYQARALENGARYLRRSKLPFPLPNPPPHSLRSLGRES